MTPNINETMEQYKYRLFQNKEKLDLTWAEITTLIYKHYGKRYSTDFLRHEYYAMAQRDSLEEIGVGNRILVLSDQHCPFNLPVDVVKDYANKVDTLIFNGDEEDCFALSKFTKKYRVPFVDEMIQTRQMIIDTINLIKPKRVIFNYGNHNIRFINYFSDKIHDDLLQLMPRTNLDFIVDIGFWKYNHEEGCKTFYEPLKDVFEDIEIIYTDDWWCKVGDTIFCHPKAYRSGILGTAEKAYLYFLQKGETFNALVMAHTHQSGLTRYGKSVLYESGALCKEPEYMKSGAMTRPQSQGFVYIVQDDKGNFVYDKSKLVFL